MTGALLALGARAIAEPSEELAGPLVRVALGIAYDGTNFHGFAPQRAVRTVGGTLIDAVSRVAGGAVTLVCAGRTDSGVHATCQVAHVELPAAALERYRDDAMATIPIGPELPRLARALSGALAPEISIWRAVIVPPHFDARRSAISRRYRYDISTSPRADPTTRHASWLLGAPLDLAAMRLGTDPLIGEHDFSAFCRRAVGAAEGPIRRRVIDAGWSVLEDGRLRFTIEARAFGHQMVRSIVGVLVAIGRGRARPSDMVAFLRQTNRIGAPTLAPPVGLCLVAVGYPNELGGLWS